LGESGTGKSHLARAIHHLSKRKGYFVEINCAALTGDTLRSELFGHTKGSFTGAVSDTVGKLSHAHNGTLFLDEIGSMSFDMQEALLKAIEEKSYYPIGSNKLVKSDFRVISATLDNLEAKIRTGKFRFDLFQRISGYTMTQPKLSDRKEDILPFLKNKLQGKRKILFKEEARKFLETYQWPGNLRELSNFAELISQSESSVIQLDEVKAFLRISKVQSATSLLTDEQYNRIKEVGLREFMDQLSMEIMEMALEENQHVATKAIAELKISTATFYKYSRKDGDLKNNPDISGAVS
jgi:DNA-binding NtrC family response regulator